MLTLSSKKFEIGSRGKKFAQTSPKTDSNDQPKFDFDVCSIDSSSNSSGERKISNKANLNTSFKVDFINTNSSNDNLYTNLELYEKEALTQGSSATEASSDESDCDQTAINSSDFIKNVQSKIGVSTNIKNSTYNIPQFQPSFLGYSNDTNLDMMFWDVSPSRMEAEMLQAPVEHSNINYEVSQDTTDVPKKKKTRRGGKRVKRQKAKRLAMEKQANEEPLPVQKEVKEQVKYKTELCKNWIEKGKCSYSIRCRFAHGPQELIQNKEVQKLQKNAKCDTFHNQGFWSYGVRCLYIHDTRNPSQINQSSFSRTLSFLSHTLANPSYNRKRLPIFDKIAPTKNLSVPYKNNVFISKKYLNDFDESQFIRDNVWYTSDDTSDTTHSDDEHSNTCYKPTWVPSSEQVELENVTLANVFENFTQYTNFDLPLGPVFNNQKLNSVV